MFCLESKFFYTVIIGAMNYILPIYHYYNIQPVGFEPGILKLKILILGDGKRSENAKRSKRGIIGCLFNANEKDFKACIYHLKKLN